MAKMGKVDGREPERLGGTRLWNRRGSISIKRSRT